MSSVPAKEVTNLNSPGKRGRSVMRNVRRLAEAVLVLALALGASFHF
jgi:hypothetical protein